MSKKSKDKRASLKTATPKEDTSDLDSVMSIVNEQQRRADLQRRGLSSQGVTSTNGAPVISNGEREAQAMQANQRGFYNIPEDMLPNSKDED